MFPPALGARLSLKRKAYACVRRARVRVHVALSSSRERDSRARVEPRAAREVRRHFSSRRDKSTGDGKKKPRAILRGQLTIISPRDTPTLAITDSQEATDIPPRSRGRDGRKRRKL